MLEMEKTLDILHSDIKSIERQISIRRVGSTILGSEDESQSKSNAQWQEKAEASLRRKITQARHLEKDLGELRANADDGVSPKYLYLNILLRIAKNADKYDNGFDPDDDLDDWVDIRKDLEHLRVVAPSLLK